MYRLTIYAVRMICERSLSPVDHISLGEQFSLFSSPSLVIGTKRIRGFCTGIYRYQTGSCFKMVSDCRGLVSPPADPTRAKPS